MALDFPASPSVNDTYTSGGRTWRWNGTAWVGATPYSGQATITGGTINNTPIGGTTRAAGAFTTVDANSNILSSGGIVGYSSGTTVYTIGSGGYNGPVGGSTPAAGAFTTLTASGISTLGPDGVLSSAGYFIGGNYTSGYLYDSGGNTTTLRGGTSGTGYVYLTASASGFTTNGAALTAGAGSFTTLKASSGLNVTGAPVNGTTGVNLEAGDIGGGVFMQRIYNRTSAAYGILELHSNTFAWKVDGGTSVLSASGTGLAVTGIASATTQFSTTGTGESFRAAGTSTAARSIRLNNTNGDCYLGVESSTAGGYFTGSSAYASVIYSAGPLETIISAVKIATVSSTGLAVTGDISAASLGTQLSLTRNGVSTSTLRTGGSKELIVGIDGTDRASFTTTGLAVAGALQCSAGYALYGPDATASILYRYNGGTNNPGLFVRADEAGNSATLYASGSAGGTTLRLGVDGTPDIATITSTGLAVTGQITSTISSGSNPNVIITNGGDFQVNCVGNSTTQMFSVRNNSSGAVHINTQNSILMALGVSTGTTGGTTVTHAAINSSGVFMVGTTTDINPTSGSQDGLTVAQSGLLTISRDGGGCAQMRRRNSDGNMIVFLRDTTSVGNIQVTTTTTTYNSGSDRRLKENIRDITNSGSIIDALHPRIHDWKTGEKDAYNFIAQELYEVFPQAVAKGDDDPETITDVWGVDPAKLVPVLVAELKALRARVAQLENK